MNAPERMYLDTGDLVYLSSGPVNVVMSSISLVESPHYTPYIRADIHEAKVAKLRDVLQRTVGFLDRLTGVPYAPAHDALANTEPKEVE